MHSLVFLFVFGFTSGQAHGFSLDPLYSVGKGFFSFCFENPISLITISLRTIAIIATITTLPSANHNRKHMPPFGQFLGHLVFGPTNSLKTFSTFWTNHFSTNSWHYIINIIDINYGHCISLVLVSSSCWWSACAWSIALNISILENFFAYKVFGPTLRYTVPLAVFVTDLNIVSLQPRPQHTQQKFSFRWALLMATIYDVQCFVYNNKSFLKHIALMCARLIARSTFMPYGHLQASSFHPISIWTLEWSV